MKYILFVEFDYDPSGGTADIKDASNDLQELIDQCTGRDSIHIELGFDGSPYIVPRSWEVLNTKTMEIVAKGSVGKPYKPTPKRSVL